MMTSSPACRIKTSKINALIASPGRSHARALAILVDIAACLAYLNRNRTPHASASVSAPGGSFFARSTGNEGGR